MNPQLLAMLQSRMATPNQGPVRDLLYRIPKPGDPEYGQDQFREPAPPNGEAMQLLSSGTQAQLDADTARTETLKKIFAMLPQNQNPELAHGGEMDTLMAQAGERINAPMWQPQLNDISGMEAPDMVRGMVVDREPEQDPNWEAKLIAARMKNIGADNERSAIMKIQESNNAENVAKQQAATAGYWASTGGQQRKAAAQAEQARRQGIMNAKNPGAWAAIAQQRQQAINNMLQQGGGNGPLGQAVAFNAMGLDPRLGAMAQENALKGRELDIMEGIARQQGKLPGGQGSPGLGAQLRPDANPRGQLLVDRGGWGNLAPEEQKQFVLGAFADNKNWAYKALEELQSYGVTPEQIRTILGGQIPEVNTGAIYDPINKFNDMMYGDAERKARAALGAVAPTPQDAAPASGGYGGGGSGWQKWLLPPDLRR